MIVVLTAVVSCPVGCIHTVIVALVSPPAWVGGGVVPRGGGVDGALIGAVMFRGASTLVVEVFFEAR